MKTNVILIISFLLLFSCTETTQKTSNTKVLNQLGKLYEELDFFKLKTTYEAKKDELSEAHSLYFEGVINKVFNKPEVSNQAIEKLLALENSKINDTLLSNLYRAKLENHINLFEYAKATQTSEYIQTNFQSLLDSSDMEMLRNEIKIWRALREVPKQQVIKNDDHVIHMYRDKVGLFNVDVIFGDSTENLLFDTGANFSAIVKSLVDKLGLKYIESDFYVTAATGVRVKSGIAIADEISLGGIIFKNVFFLVLDDKDLSFPQIDYYPKGAIGFPVIEAMDEIRINKENQIFVPQNPVQYTLNNFALNGLMPIIAAKYNSDTLRFDFDTGATATSLYPLFYKKYKAEIEKNYEKETFESGSGGGTIEFEGYVLKDIKLKIANSQATLNKVRLHSEKFGSSESKVHGNFGQDYIKQFDEMIISFKYSSVLFN